MPEDLEKILKKMPENMSKANSQTTSNKEDPYLPGDPNCPICHGLGYYRLDVPVNHPDFGKLQICSCRKKFIQKEIQERLYAMSNLDELSHLTFENFKPRGRIGLAPLQADSLEQAYNLAKQFAHKQKGWLLIQGRYGCGKTHLAAAIANFAVEMEIPTLFITVPDLLDTLRYTYQDPSATFEERFEEIRRIPLLILDDFGTQNATSWAQEKLFQILNYRYINQLPLVITTNLSLEEIEGRMRSRLQDPDIVTHIRIYAPDYRQPADDTGHQELSSLGLLSRLTFGNFSLRKDEDINKENLERLERAFQAARNFAENPNGWIVFTGPYGSGKTHLAAAIANYRASLGSPPLFISVPDFLDHLRATFNPSSAITYDRLFDEVRTTPLLILDDLSTQSMTAWVREKLYQLFNHRYYAELPTVITSSETLEDMDSRIRSRMLDTRLCTIYATSVPDYRGGSFTKKRRQR